VSDIPETKVCPLCAETIKAAAKLCPHCRTRQNRFARLTGEIVGALVVMALLVALVSFLDLSSSDDNESNLYRGFAAHRDDLQVVRTTLEAGPRQSEFWLTGYVTNKGERPWRVHELEVRFLDARGNMVDVQHPWFGKYDAFVAQPAQEHAFRIALGKVAQTNAVNTCRVRVQSASDGRQHYDPS
jgi:hypothetical protein